MGLEKDDEPDKGPPLFAGKQIRVRFPDAKRMNEINGKVEKLRMEEITFPDWSHKIFLNEQWYEVLGKDLQVGMCFVFDGALVPIIDIDFNVDYVGKMEQRLKIGHLPPEKYKRYSFKRSVKDDGINEWIVSDFIEKNAISLNDSIFIITDSTDIAEEAKQAGVQPENILIPGIMDELYTVADCIEAIRKHISEKKSKVL